MLDEDKALIEGVRALGATSGIKCGIVDDGWEGSGRDASWERCVRPLGHPRSHESNSRDGGVRYWPPHEKQTRFHRGRPPHPDVQGLLETINLLASNLAERSAELREKRAAIERVEALVEDDPLSSFLSVDKGAVRAALAQEGGK